MNGRLTVIVFIICTGVELSSAGGGSWSYDDHHGTGPNSWNKDFPNCGGSKQSPINIEPAKATQEHMGEFNFQGYDCATGCSYTITNNGHTVQLNVASGNITVTGGQLPNDAPYRLAQFHVHWGSSNNVGSEHAVDGQYYPLEIHLVHYNTRYENIKAALEHSDGLAVLGIFAEVGNTRHEVLQNFINHFHEITNAGETATIQSFPLKGLLPGNTAQFTRYDGSLTTPGCSEVVTWTVFRRPITISQTQLNAFRALNHYEAGLNQEPLVDNYRPVQPVGKRIVKRSYEPTTTIPENDGHRHVHTTSILFGMAISVAGFLFLH